MKKFKVCVVGCGNIARTHLSVLSALENVEISGVVDCKNERADAFAEKYGCVAYYDFEKMLSESEVDCVHICTPHYLHAKMAQSALKKGINVLCEKPCAISESDLNVLKSAVLESRAQFGVCFQNRYNACVGLAKRIIESESYGPLQGVGGCVRWFRDETYYSDDWHGKAEKEGGGVLTNQAIHTVDLLRYLVGDEVEFVTGHVFNDSLRGIIEVEDTATVRYEFKNGLVALLDASNAFSINSDVVLDFFFESGVRLHMSGQNLYLFDGDGNVERLSKNRDIGHLGKSYWGNGHGALIEDFYRCLELGKRFPIDFLEGSKAVSEVLAVYRSSRTDQKVRVEYF